MKTKLLLVYAIVSAMLSSMAVLPARADSADSAPRVMFQKKGEKTRISGKLTRSDDQGFEITRGEQTLTLKWSDLDANNIFIVRSAALAKGSAQEWMQFGMDLRAMDGGEKLAEKAFARAARLDPTIKPEIDKAKKDADAAAFGVHSTGQNAWPVMGEDENQAAIAQLNQFAAAAKKELNVPLELYETKFFLFYSDISKTEAKNWSGLLDRMYGKLADLFAVPKGENIWQGKGLVFVFAKAEDYQRFEAVMHHTNAAGSAGMCTSSSSGWDHIAFYRQPDELEFAHVLVHESVHGFIHRYRTSVNVPSWANEGLAEVIASELVPQNGRSSGTMEDARYGLRERGMGGLFALPHINGWQYPVAETLCDYMIKQNKKAYVSFIVGIKEGLSAEDSLAAKYKMPKDRLVASYGQAMGVNGLAP